MSSTPASTCRSRPCISIPPPILTTSRVSRENSYFEAFVAYADSGTLDGIVMGKDSLTALGKTGRLLDLSSEACSSIRAKYGDRFLYAVPLDEEYGGREVPVCIDISDSRLVSEYGIYSEPVALGIGALSKNVDAVELFLDFLYSDPGSRNS